MRPYDIRVRPFTDTIQSIISYIERAIRPSLLGTKYENCQFDFNFLEIKLYLGQRLVDEHCNQSVGAHTDCMFDDKGEQSKKDSARGDHLTAILTFGYQRKLFFVRCSKDRRSGKPNKWQEKKCPNDYLNLEHNSLFLLFPEDEKPTPSEVDKHILHKTKHGVKFAGKTSPFSLALVFRSVKKTSLFHSTSDRLPDGIFNNNSLAYTYKKDSWCWAGLDGLVESEDNIYARDFLQNRQKQSAFRNADKKFDASHVLTCANRLLNEIRRYSQKKT